MLRLYSCLYISIMENLFKCLNSKHSKGMGGGRAGAGAAGCAGVRY